MNKKNYYEWDQPKEFINYLNDLRKEMSKPNFFFKMAVKIGLKLFHNVTLSKNLNPHVEVNDEGIFSESNIDGIIKYEEIMHIEFEFKEIPSGKVKVMVISHYEDMENMIPDITTYAIPDDFDINGFTAFIEKKASHIKIEENVQ